MSTIQEVVFQCVKQHGPISIRRLTQLLKLPEKSVFYSVKNGVRHRYLRSDGKGRDEYGKLQRLFCCTDKSYRPYNTQRSIGDLFTAKELDEEMTRKRERVREKMRQMNPMNQMNQSKIEQREKVCEGSRIIYLTNTRHNAHDGFKGPLKLFSSAIEGGDL